MKGYKDFDMVQNKILLSTIISNLKKKAKAANSETWCIHWDHRCINGKSLAFGYIRTRNNAFHIITCTEESILKNSGDIEFIAAVNPKEIMELIDRIETLITNVEQAEIKIKNLETELYVAKSEST